MPRHADLTAPKRKGFCQPFLRVSSSHQLPSRPALTEQRGTLAHGTPDPASGESHCPSFFPSPSHTPQMHPTQVPQPWSQDSQGQRKPLSREKRSQASSWSASHCGSSREPLDSAPQPLTHSHDTPCLPRDNILPGPSTPPGPQREKGTEISYPFQGQGAQERRFWADRGQVSFSGGL